MERHEQESLRSLTTILWTRLEEKSCSIGEFCCFSSWIFDLTHFFFRKAQKSKDAEVRLDQGESVTKNSRAEKKKWQDFEFFALQTVKEEVAEEAVVIEEDDTGLLCRLCCKSNAIPTNSVNDDVIVDFLNVTSLVSSSCSRFVSVGNNSHIALDSL